jgi:hypothetical protein
MARIGLTTNLLADCRLAFLEQLKIRFVTPTESGSRPSIGDDLSVMSIDDWLGWQCRSFFLATVI